MIQQSLTAVQSSKNMDGVKPMTYVGPSSHYSGEQLVPPSDLKRLNSRLVSLLRPNSAEAFGYYRLRIAAENLLRTEGANVLAVSSARVGEGKTLTAINLAGALAKNPENRVLLIELDVRGRQPGLARYFGLKQWSQHGAVEYLSRSSTLWNDAVYYMPAYNLYVMPVEKKCESPYELLGSSRLGEMISEARGKYDHIVIDTSPITMAPDTQLIARWVDRFLLVVAADNTTESVLGECLELMDPEQVLGLVFNACQVDRGKELGSY